MKYLKPEIVKLSDAVDAILGQTSKFEAPPDNTTSTTQTVSAYVADE